MHPTPNRRDPGGKVSPFATDTLTPLFCPRSVAIVRASDDPTRISGRTLRYLIDERGLATSTAQRYVSLARLFLAQHATTGELHLEDLAARQVSEFVLGECTRQKVGSAKCLVVRLRSLLRFLHVDGRTSSSLVAARGV